MQVTVKLNPLAGTVPEAIAQLRAILAAFEVDATPLHPGSDDAQLQYYYTVEAPDAQHAAALLAQLRASPAVEGAYVKPADALP